MLEQLLKSGLSMMNANPGNQSGDAGWGKLGAGAATGGVLGLLLGSKRGRSMGGTALKYGSIAAIGAVAYKAYNQWQAQQTQVAQSAKPLPSAAPASRETPRLPAPGLKAELESQARSGCTAVTTVRTKAWALCAKSHCSMWHSLPTPGWRCAPSP